MTTASWKLFFQILHRIKMHTTSELQKLSDFFFILYSSQEHEQNGSLSSKWHQPII